MDLCKELEKYLNLPAFKERKIQADLFIKHGEKVAEFDNYYIMKFEGKFIYYVIKLSDCAYRLFDDEQSAINYALDSYNTSGKQKELELT